jgi:hypothetical protein
MFRYISRRLVTCGDGVEFAHDLLASITGAGDARGSGRCVGAFAASVADAMVLHFCSGRCDAGSGRSSRRAPPPSASTVLERYLYKALAPCLGVFS